MSVTAKPPLVDIDVRQVRDVLARAEGVLAREDHQVLVCLFETLLELTKLVRQKGTTIARLRSMLGFTSSETMSQLLGEDGDDGEGKDGDADAPDASGDSPDDSGDSSEANAPASNGEATGGEGKPKDKPKGHGRIPASDYDAEHIHVPHEHLRRGDRCPGCRRGNLCEQRDPVQWLRIFGRPPLVATCWDCDSYRCSACGAVYTATPPEQARGPKYSESAASMMALLRYGMGVPLNRLAQLQGQLHIPVPASTQWDVVLQPVAAVSPVYEQLRQRAADGSLLHTDDTFMRVLEFMGKRRAKLLAKGQLPSPDRTGLFTTGVVSVTDDGPIVMFVTGRNHAGENLDELLDQRQPHLEPPLLMCDALDRNRPKKHDVIECNCLVHGRRHIAEQLDNFPPECRHVIVQLAKVFKYEADCKKDGRVGTERLLFHQEHSAPVLTELKEWMEAQLEERRVEPNSGLGKAFKYFFRHWDKLTRFLRVLDAPLDNNLCYAERGITVVFFRSRTVAGGFVGRQRAVRFRLTVVATVRV